MFGWQSVRRWCFNSKSSTPKTVTRNRPIARRFDALIAYLRVESISRRATWVGTLPVPPAPQNPPFPSPPAPPATTCVLAGLLLAFVPPVGAPGSHGHLGQLDPPQNDLQRR